MKREIKKAFKVLYPEQRLLAVQLNGFSHKIFYDAGSSTSAVVIEEYNPWTRVERQTEQVRELLKGYPTEYYKGNPKEIVYIKPEER